MSENGTLKASYVYDDLGQLVRENNKDANKATNDLLDATGKYLDAVLEYRKKVDNELTITYDDEEETVTIDELIETMSAIHDALKKEAGK